MGNAKRFAKAMELEKEDKVREAAEEYELHISEGNAKLEAYLNLAFLYWQSTEYGFSASLGLGKDFIDLAATRYKELLTDAKGRFPSESEIEFWERYFGFIDLGENFPEEECRRFTDDENEVAASFHLYALSNGRAYKNETERLLQVCSKEPTLKNRYIVSIIEAVKAHSDPY